MDGLSPVALPSTAGSATSLSVLGGLGSPDTSSTKLYPFPAPDPDPEPDPIPSSPLTLRLPPPAILLLLKNSRRTLNDGLPNPTRALGKPVDILANGENVPSSGDDGFVEGEELWDVCPCP
jgi:hypothetical protein